MEELCKPKVKVHNMFSVLQIISGPLDVCGCWDGEFCKIKRIDSSAHFKAQQSKHHIIFYSFIPFRNVALYSSFCGHKR